MRVERGVSRMYWLRDSAAGLNFGDWIGPFLFKARRGYDPVFTAKSGRGRSGVFFTCGSILHKIFEPDRAIVWGSGAIREDFVFERPKEIFAVRGPLTRKVCLSQGYSCSEVYGDPGLLLPRFYSPPAGQSRSRLGVVPHYVDFADLAKLFSEYDDVRVIDVRRSVAEVVDDIVSCDYIVSTSLHGYIVAAAYGVPALWSRYSDRLIGGNFKFHDFFLGVGYDQVPTPFMLSKVQALDQLMEMVEVAPTFPKSSLSDELLSCCPF